MPVEREVVLPIERDEAWRLVTDEGELSRWLAPEVELDPVVGGAIAAEEPDGRVQVGVVEDVVEGERIVFRWSDLESGDESTVEIDLHDVEGGTRITVVETVTPALSLGGVTALAFATA